VRRKGVCFLLNPARVNILGLIHALYHIHVLGQIITFMLLANNQSRSHSRSRCSSNFPFVPLKIPLNITGTHLTGTCEIGIDG
jgi:hypothetical protein